MRLPNGERAVVDVVKLRDYCLNPDHLRGRHKARVFASALGLTAGDADGLRGRILEAAVAASAQAAARDAYGQRYVLDFMCDGPGGTAMVRTCWIIRAGEDFPRLTSCYVL
jgi:hypothetical protein